MKAWTLRRRLHLLLLQFLALALVLGGLVAFATFHRYAARVREERLLLARTLGLAMDAALAGALESLSQVPAQLTSLDAEANRVLRSYRLRSPFHEAVYVLAGEDASVLAADPAGVAPLPRGVLGHHGAVSGPYRKGGARVLAAVIPFQSEGRTHLLVAEMDPASSPLMELLDAIEPHAEPGLRAAVTDREGMVLAAPTVAELFRTVLDAGPARAVAGSRQPAILQAEPGPLGGASGGEALLAVVPLRHAPWALLVEQPHQEAFAAPYAWRRAYLVSGGILVLIGVLLARALSRSILAPIRELSRQAERIRRGDLDQPIVAGGDREIAALGATMEEARVRLAGSLGELRALNQDLETQVESRTLALQRQYESLRLLHGVAAITSRERDPDRFLPAVLARLGEASGGPFALVATPTGAAARAYRYPEDTALPWLEPGAAAPAGWRRDDLEGQGVRVGQLYAPVGALDAPVLASLLPGLALALHDAELMRQARVQDAERRVLVRRLLAAGEEERCRIARELHDEIAQLLTVIHLALDRAGSDPAEMDRAKTLLARAQAEIHRVIYDLRPSLLDDLGLAAAIGWYVTTYLRPAGLSVNLEIEEELRLAPEVEVTAFRVCQEILTNVLRHARAENVSIELGAGDGRLVLDVEDDGVGFSPQDRHEGAGLVGMRERAGLVGGTIRFDSEPGMGTHVRLEIPVQP